MIKIGGLADLHYDTGDKSDRANKVDKFVADMETYNPNFIIQLGDFIDVGWDEEKWDTVATKFENFTGKKYYVYGNHEYEKFYDDPSQGITRDLWLEKVEYETSYYSFDEDEYHIIVLDTNYSVDGTTYPASWSVQRINDEQHTWLINDLSNTPKKTIVFCHARLDGTWYQETGKNVFTTNARTTRQILENSGKVIAVIMGHDKQDFRTLHGIHYIGLYQPWNGEYPTSPYSKIEITDNRIVVTSVDGGLNYDTAIQTGTNPLASTLIINA